MSVAAEPRWDTVLRMAADPEDPLARIDAALEAGDFEQALLAAQAGLVQRPEDPELHHALGLALRGVGRLDEALDALQAATRLSPDLADAWLDAAEILVEDLGDEVRALEVLAAARKRLKDPVHAAEAELLRGIALSHLEDFTGALRAVDEAGRLDPAHPDVPTERGAVLVELLRLPESEAALRKALEVEEENPRAHHLLGFVLDYTGRRDEALRHFRRAAALDPELPSEPPRLTEPEFDAALEEAVQSIPSPFSERLVNVEISVENYADREFCRRHDCSPTTLGVFVGTPLTLRAEGEARQLPDRIVLFQRALENASGSRAELVEEIAVTIKHEIGHLLGFSEDELHERGYE